MLQVHCVAGVPDLCSVLNNCDIGWVHWDEEGLLLLNGILALELAFLSSGLHSSFVWQLQLFLAFVISDLTEWFLAAVIFFLLESICQCVETHLIFTVSGCRETTGLLWLEAECVPDPWIQNVRGDEADKTWSYSTCLFHRWADRSQRAWFVPGPEESQCTEGQECQRRNASWLAPGYKLCEPSTEIFIKDVFLLCFVKIN